MVEDRQRANHTGHHGHRVRVATETGIELGQLLMHHRMVLDGFFEIDLLLGIRQFAVLQQVGHLKEIAVFGQLLDRVTAIEEFALVAIDKGDLGLAASRRKKTGVVGKQSGLAAQRANIDAIVAMRRGHDRKIDGSLSIDCQNCLAFGRHGVFPVQVLIVTALPKKRSTFPI